MIQSKIQKNYTIPQEQVNYIIGNYKTKGITKIAEVLKITKGVAYANLNVYLNSLKQDETIFDVTKEKWFI